MAKDWNPEFYPGYLFRPEPAKPQPIESERLIIRAIDRIVLELTYIRQALNDMMEARK